MSGPSTDGPPPPETVAPTAATAAAGTVVIPDWDDGAKPVSEFDAGPAEPALPKASTAPKADALLDGAAFELEEGEETANALVAPGSEPEATLLTLEGRAQCKAIKALWFAKSVADSIPVVALRQFIIMELEAPPAMQAIIYGVVYAIPWNLKFFAAFTSDTLPICGRRRRPYMISGVLVECLCWTLLSLLPGSIVLTACLMFIQKMGSLFKCVMLDTVTVETMNRYETGAQKGRLQSSTWLWGAAGGMLGNLFGGIALTYWPHFTHRQMMSIRAVLVVFELAIMTQIQDPKVAVDAAVSCVSHTKRQAGIVWEAMHEDRVWKPMLFIMVFHVFPNNSDAFTSFILGDPAHKCEAGQTDCLELWPGGVAPLHFTDAQYGYVNLLSQIGLIIGIWAYKTYFHTVAWRPYFAAVIVVSSLLSCTQLILISGLNRALGIPDIVFALGDDLVTEVAAGFLSMPLWVLMGSIVPAGTEGSVFALVTSLRAVGNACSGTLSAILTGAFGVSLEDYSNLGHLTWITALAKLLAIPFVLLVPKSILHAQALETRDRRGAVFLAFGLFAGTLWAICTAVYKLATYESPYETEQ